MPPKNYEYRKKTSAEKRTNRSRTSDYRLGSGAKKLKRREEWIITCEAKREIAQWRRKCSWEERSIRDEDMIPGIRGLVLQKLLGPEDTFGRELEELFPIRKLSARDLNELLDVLDNESQDTILPYVLTRELQTRECLEVYGEPPGWTPFNVFPPPSFADWNALGQPGSALQCKSNGEPDAEAMINVFTNVQAFREDFNDGGIMDDESAEHWSEDSDEEWAGIWGHVPKTLEHRYCPFEPGASSSTPPATECDSQWYDRSSGSSSSSSSHMPTPLEQVFLVCPPDQVERRPVNLSKQRQMRSKEYMRETGFLWGTGKNTKKVRNRFYAAVPYSEVPSDPSLEELLQYIKPRQAELRLDETTITSYSGGQLGKSFPGEQTGTWFRAPTTSKDAPRFAIEDSNCDTVTKVWLGLESHRAWSGVNMYILWSIFRFGWKGSWGKNGQFGGWCHKDSTRKRCGSYMYYVQSGTGIAWGVLLELLVDRTRGRTAQDQWVQDEGSSAIVAVWFHGVKHKDFFGGQYIWPAWDPGLEVRILPRNYDDEDSDLE